MRLAVLICAVMAIAAPAAAQPREPRAQLLADLSRTLGEAHALRQLCEGKTDQYWRERMQQMLAAEHPDRPLETSLEVAFNSGFAAGQSQFATCSAEARQVQAQVAARGEALSRRLAAPD